MDISKSIIYSDRFLDMPISTKALYFYLVLEADKQGYIHNIKSIMRMIVARDDDFNILVAKRFILLDDGVYCLADGDVIERSGYVWHKGE